MFIKEENFIERLKKKDEDALIYVRDYYGWIIKTVLKKELTYIPEMYDECFNDCLFFIWKNISSFDENKGKFETWVGSIAKYRSIDYKRKYIKEKIRGKKISDKFDIGEESMTLEKILNKEIEEEVYKIISNLNEENRNIFWDYYIKGYKADEISRKYKISTQSIYSRMFRSKKKLKEFIENKKEKRGKKYEKKI